eukprot:1977016-Pyramimonas_sp.AAC.1
MARQVLVSAVPTSRAGSSMVRRCFVPPRAMNRCRRLVLSAPWPCPFTGHSSPSSTCRADQPHICSSVEGSNDTTTRTFRAELVRPSAAVLYGSDRSAE